ncbi:sugar diacid recognition domain-containing protein [Bisgaard Taxon 10/6]|uniref:sugar diacid recognition domain-containing protein n=1 Tax=Exercitatus varius TaxID=67857 RepID=UPI00294AE85E|nr:sugar diacid recognition domain-containing protein [Exercitatus varius]MDG2915958.1 sugar diacid recognition domain-containing protein [Exercitatus varius]
MKLNKTIAQNIVQRTMKIIDSSVNVMDEQGIIIASGDPRRLNQKHIGAMISIRENRTVIIDEELVRKWNHEVKMGINLPIVYLGEILGVVGISGEPEQVKPYAELVKMTAELIIEQHVLLEKERWERRYREEFILQLLENKIPSNTLINQAKFFQFDLQTPTTVAIIKLQDSTINKLQSIVTYLETKYNCAVLSLSEIAVLLPSTQCLDLLQNKQTNKLLPPDMSYHEYKIAIGTHFTFDMTIAQSFQTALSTLNFGLRSYPKRSLYVFEQHRLPVLLDNLSATWQAEKLLEPLQALYDNDETFVLQKTLQQYFLSNCDLALTSKNLFIHINTLRYRLAKIERITGLYFNKIDDKFIFYLSTILNKLL